MTFILIVAFVYGTVLSSFFTLVGYRVPMGISIVKPNSHCFNCKKKLTFLDLIPIISYLLNRGKCRGCGIRYGSMHVWTELTVGLLFVFATYFNLDSLIKLVFILASILILNTLFVSLVEYKKLMVKLNVIFTILMGSTILMSIGHNGFIVILIFSMLLFIFYNYMFIFYKKKLIDTGYKFVWLIINLTYIIYVIVI